MAKNTPIKEALGLGEVIKFSDGTQLPCVPACLADLEDAIQHWAKSLGSGLSIQGCYLPGNEEAKEAFEELLFIACGRKIPKEELRRKVTVADGGREVMDFLARFLGLNLRPAGEQQG
ncbi:hypothetical protein GCM10025857_14840 [Alicyclobacillus contaminans]|uniref:hypothetical protein n=1 Tax=Alicyclobacillus contaminans TaxID=392016 RepID=UPI000402B5E2|nr:hypothetical protein [Alicyclobacillus contaminans]GMA50127.1 hypothetical protein GCM10025857_14840 [Alicyclobacillus contaminans]